MGLFSRNDEALEATRGDVPFDVKRSPRSSRGPRSSLDGNPDAPPALDPAQTAKTRARHRLIGAVVLATAAVVFVPMLFDRAPVATPDDLSLQIPDRDTPFEGRKGVPDASRGPLKGSSDLPQPTQTVPPVVPAPAEPAKATPTEAPSKADAVSEPSTKVATVEPKADARPDTRAPVADASAPEPKPVAKAVPPTRSAETPAPPQTDDPKALAALEGKSPDAPKAAVGAHGYAVQVAAYAQMSMAKSMQDKLVANGLKAYTQSTTASNGNPVIRVRLGPYASLDAADRAKAKLKTMKLDGSVVPQ